MTFRTEYENYFKQEVIDINEYTGFYDEIDIKDFKFDSENEMFYYPCPCGDNFEISLDSLENGEIIAGCPSCSLAVHVIYEDEDLQSFRN